MVRMFLVFAVGLAACSGGTSREETAESAPPTTVADTGAVLPSPQEQAQNDTSMLAPGVQLDSISDLDRFIVFGLARIGFTRADVQKNLGSPDSSRAEPFENRHIPGKIDSIYHVHFPEASASFYDAGDREMVMNVTVRSNRLLRLPVIRIGMPWDSLTAEVGAGAPDGGNAFRYSCSVCVVDHEVVVTRENERVASIGFNYYLD